MRHEGGKGGGPAAAAAANNKLFTKQQQQRRRALCWCMKHEATRVSLFGFLRQRAFSCPLLLQEIVNASMQSSGMPTSQLLHWITKHQATKPLRWHTFFER